jgi:predicted O-methyltransferase YrrM
MDRWLAVDAFLTGRLAPSDPALDGALAATVPPHQISPLQGRLLEVLARSVGARAILEIGTLAGYSTLWLARALPDDGRLVTLEADARHAAVARENLSRAGIGAAIDVIEGPALTSLERVEGPFDFAFLDADKAESAAYFDRTLPLVRRGGLIVADNVVRGGAVVDGEDPAARGVRALIDRLAAEPRVAATALQTVGAKGHDGFAIAVVK